MNDLYGAIEAGGTKFVCAIGSGPDDMELCRIETTSPAETLGHVTDFFKPHSTTLRGIGVASFGPLDLNSESTTYGFITSTPKPGWANTNLLAFLQRELKLPIAFDTDVNAAALGEAAYGAARELKDFIYLTIGTGIGGGVVANSHLIHGLVHTELGHILLPKHPDDSYEGHCPFHGDKCFEGLACGPAISARWGKKSSELECGHPAWELQAWYMGAALASFVCTLSPQRIILGGGVMEVEGLLQKIQAQTAAHLNSYVQHASITEHMNKYIVLPELGARAGVIGALELIRRTVL